MGNAATYNAQTPASYNVNTVATYNAPQAGGTTTVTIAPGYAITAAGAPAGNSVAAGSYTSATLVSYYSPTGTNDNVTATVQVATPGGAATIISS